MVKYNKTRKSGTRTAQPWKPCASCGVQGNVEATRIWGTPSLRAGSPHGPCHAGFRRAARDSRWVTAFPVLSLFKNDLLLIIRSCLCRSSFFPTLGSRGANCSDCAAFPSLCSRHEDSISHCLHHKSGLSHQLFQLSHHKCKY